MPPEPVSDWAKPSTSSKAAATQPPWTQPGGPSYAEPNPASPKTRPFSSRITIGGAIGFARPIIGLWSKKPSPFGEGGLGEALVAVARGWVARRSA